MRWLPGHPLHPPLTDATIGIYTAATVFACSAFSGSPTRTPAHAWWLAVVVGLVVTVPTALTGLIEWLTIPRASKLWKTATAHLAAMVSATVLFLLAAIAGHGGYADGEVTTGGLVLTLVAYGTMALSGWFGGSIVFVHGMRVLSLVDEPVERPVTPAAHPENGAAAGQRT